MMESIEGKDSQTNKASKEICEQDSTARIIERMDAIVMMHPMRVEERNGKEGEKSSEEEEIELEDGEDSKESGQEMNKRARLRVRAAKGKDALSKLMSRMYESKKSIAADAVEDGKGREKREKDT
ncbi:MAG: hypothetical protein AB7D92_11565 [Sphaerochaeta sp.]